MDKGKAPLIEDGVNESVPMSVESGHLGQTTSPNVQRSSHDISRVQENPWIRIGHGRTQSEPLVPHLSDENDEDLVSMYFDVDKFTSSMDDLGSVGSEMNVKAASSSNIQTANSVKPSDEERQQVRTARLIGSQSIDGLLPSYNLGMLASSLESSGRKSKSDARLAAVALVDPVRARRIISNRQSAARSRERVRYMVGLEQKVELLQMEAAALSVHLSLCNQNNSALTGENNKLMMHQRMLEEQIKVQYASDNTLQKEVQQLKVLTAQLILHGGQMMNFGSSSYSRNLQFDHHDQVAESFLVDPNLQQLELRSLNQQQVLKQPEQPPSVLTIDGSISPQGKMEDDSSTFKE